MRKVTAFPIVPLRFRSRDPDIGAFFSLRASLRRWRRRASVDAIGRALTDASLNPYLFLIESDH